MKTRLIFYSFLLFGLSVGIFYLVAPKRSQEIRQSPGIKNARALQAKPRIQNFPEEVAARQTKDPEPDSPYFGEGAAREIVDKGELIFTEESPGAMPGQLTRTRVLRCEGKYPFLRVEEKIIIDDSLNHEVLIDRQLAVANHVIVRLRKGEHEEKLDALAKTWGDGIIRKLNRGNLYLVETPMESARSLSEAIEWLETEDIVDFAEPDYLVHTSLFPNDPGFGQLWGLNNTGQDGGIVDADIDAPEAWDQTTGDSGIVVAVIDTGVAYDHPDLAANMWTNAGEIPDNGIDDDGNGFVDDVFGWNFSEDNNDPYDDHFHGTHCAGTIGAVGNNGIGVAGASWNVKMMALKFLSAGGGGYTSDAIGAIDYARSMGVKVMSNSWGGGGYSQALKDSIDAASDAGILFVAAAGNDSSNNDFNPQYPAGYDCANMISVAATDHNDQLAGFSNYGAETVHIAAPGVGIYSTFPTAATQNMTAYGLPVSYARISGTSMATPQVAGVAVLALAQDPTLSVTQLRAKLLLRADTKTQFVGKVEGARRLNAFNVTNPSWQPEPAFLTMTGYDYDDTDEGDGDGVASPGETASLLPTLLNVGGVDADHVTVELIANQPGSTVLAPSTLTLNSLVPLSGQQPIQAWRVQLDGSLPDITELSYDVVIRANGISDRTESLRLLVSRPKPISEASLSFKAGEMVADPGRNQVYLINKTGSRVLAFNTETGVVAAIASLAGSPAIYVPPGTQSLGTGHLAVSVDGTRLYVALSGARKIQVFSLPDLNPLGTLPVDFEPESLACGAGGRLYAASTTIWEPVREINTVTGQVVQNIYTDYREFADHTILRANQDGTRLYAGEAKKLTLPGPGFILEYDITGSTALLLGKHYYWDRFMRDFQMDSGYQRLYTATTYGVGATDLASGQAGDIWSSDLANPFALAVPPTSIPVLYAASGRSTDGRIRMLQRSDGRTIRDFHVTTDNLSIPPHGMVVTPNGNVAYLRGDSVLGVIGLDSLTVAEPPVQPGPAELGINTVNFNDAEGNSDGVPNPGEIITLSPEIRNSGGEVATNVSLQLVVGTGATLLSNADQPLGSLNPAVSVTSTGYRIQIHAGLPTDTVIELVFTVQWDTGQTKTLTYSIVIQSSTIQNEVLSPLQFSEIMADQQRNQVYLLDKRHRRVMAFDTNRCRMSYASPLDGRTLTNGKPTVPGMMAQSIDGSRLYVALGDANGIQCFALPDLTPLGTWFYDFAPYAITCGQSDNLYVISSTTSRGVIKIDAVTGAFLGESPAVSGKSYNKSSMLRRNTTGSEIYASRYDMIDRFSVFNGSLTLVNSYDASDGANPGAIGDFTIDEANSRIYSAPAAPHILVVPLDGSPTSTWLTASGYNGANSASCAVSISPATGELLGTSGAGFNGGVIRRFDRSTGAPLQDHVLFSNGSQGMLDRGVAATPNGRIVYVKRGLGNTTNSVDNYDYWLGVVGGTVDIDLPDPGPVVLKSAIMTDPSPANGNGFANPGEAVKLDVNLKNLSDNQLNDVTLELVSSNPKAVVQSPASFSIGRVRGYESFGPSSDFTIALHSSLADATEIKLTLKVASSSGMQQEIPYSLFIDKMVRAEITSGFTIGEMIADPTRNIVYVVDNTNNRLLAMDTQLGRVAATSTLAGAVGSMTSMALSSDGSELHVSLTNSKKIQSFSLPDLVQKDLVNLDVGPVNIAYGSDGELCFTSNEAGFGRLRKLDLQLGTARVFGPIYTYTAGYPMTINQDRTRLFVARPSQVHEYSIAEGSEPTIINTYSLSFGQYSGQALVDDEKQLLYRVPASGIGVTELDSGLSVSPWSFNGQTGVDGRSIAFLPDSPFVYAGSQRVYGGPAANGVFRFSRDEERCIGMVTTGEGMMYRSLAMTPNGRLVYGRALSGVYYLGMVGVSSITLNTTNRAPLIDLGANREVEMSKPVHLNAAFSDDGPTTGFDASWEVISGPDGIIISSSSGSSAVVSFANTGTYLIRATVDDDSLSASDLITITVVPDKPSVSVTASRPAGTRSGPVPAVFTFSRTEQPVDPLIANYSVSGSANGGTDYVPLSGSVNFPAGVASVDVIVLPIETAPAFGNGKTVIVDINPGSTYEIGISRGAAVTLKDHDYLAWRAHFLGAAEIRALAGDDADDDGIANLMEYALGLHPLQPNRTGLPVMSKSGDRMTLTFTRRREPVDVQYQVMVSENLADWEPAGFSEEVIPVDDFTETVIATDNESMNSHEKRFLRLEVTRP